MTNESKDPTEKDVILDLNSSDTSKSTTKPPTSPLPKPAEPSDKPPAESGNSSDVTQDTLNKPPTIRLDSAQESTEKPSAEPVDEPDATVHLPKKDEAKESVVNFDTSKDRPETWVSRTSLLNSKRSFIPFGIEEDDDEQVDRDTAVLSRNNPRWRRLIDQQSSGGTTTLGDQREVLFVIRGMIERVVMSENSIVTLGRFDAGTQANKEIDLNPYGGMDRGVSRHHAKIQLLENQLYVIDLESTNGTFLAGTRLEPNKPTLLRKGDELMLGRLSVQVLFR